MANEQYAFLNKAQVPSRQAWQAVIDECGFDFQLDPDLKPFEDSGFLPCKFMGVEGGFEIYCFPAADVAADFGDIVRGRDFCISFRWGGSMVECACVMIASYALARGFDAVVSYEGEEPAESLEAFLRETQECVELAKKDL
jgi:hypothetical protein